MTSASPLSLRLRTGESVPSEPDLAAFCGRPRRLAPELVMRPGPAASATDVALFVPQRELTIPLPGRATVPPATAAWNVRASIPGHVASVQLHAGRARVTRTRRAPWLVAACLPLSLAAEAMAAPSPGVQRPKLPSPTLPDAGDTTPPTDAAGTDAATTDAGTPAVEGGDTEVVAPAPDDADAATTPVPPPAIAASVVDAAWEGVDGFDVDVQLAGGARKRGIVGAVQRETFTLIDHETGEVFVLRKDAVVGLRVHRPPPLPTSTGNGMIAGGVVLDVIGAPLFISGVVILGVCPSCVGIHLPLTIVGAASLGAGIPVTIRGVRQRRKYLRAAQEHGLAFGVAPTREGWTGGLRFRF